MATVTGYTADRMKQIEDETVVMGEVDAGGNLVLTTRAGVQIDAGHVRGEDATALLTVEDTPTVNLTLTGAGTPANPWLLKAETIEQTALALLDPFYIGPGPAKVSFLPSGSLSTEAYQWTTKYIPSGNRVVNMLRRGNTWVITGHSAEEGYGGKIALELENGFQSYNYRNGLPGNRWGAPRAQRLPSGIVVLSGLVGYGSTSAGGTVIATLPPMYRPDTNLLFGVNNGDTPRCISIHTNGQIRISGGNFNGTGTYVSFDGIAFPAAGVADWTTVGEAGSGSSFANGWTAYNTGTWGIPKYWKDPYGFVWFTGLVGGGSTAADNTVMVNLPASHRTHLQGHHHAAAGDNFGFVGSQPNNGLNWKTGTSSSVWVTLCGVILATTDAVNNNPWIDTGFVNGWLQYDTFPIASFLRRADGLGMSKGLVRAGTAPAIKIANLRDEHMPNASIILSGVSAQAFYRHDIYSKDWSVDDDRGAFRAQTGSNAWVSWDSYVWMVGD